MYLLIGVFVVFLVGCLGVVVGGVVGGVLGVEFG